MTRSSRDKSFLPGTTTGDKQIRSRRREKHSSKSFSGCGETSCIYDQTKAPTAGTAVNCNSCYRSKTRCDRLEPSCGLCQRRRVYRRNRQGTAKWTASAKVSENAESASQVTGNTPSTVFRIAESKFCPSSVKEKGKEADHEEKGEGQELTSRTQLSATTHGQKQPEEDQETFEGETINWGDDEDFGSRLPI